MRPRPGIIDVGLRLVSSAGELVALVENMEDGAPESEFPLHDLEIDDRQSSDDCYLLEVRTRA